MYHEKIKSSLQEVEPSIINAAINLLLTEVTKDTEKWNEVVKPLCSILK